MIFLSLDNILLYFHKIENRIPNHSKGQIYPVLLAGWRIVPSFVALDVFLSNKVLDV